MPWSAPLSMLYVGDHGTRGVSQPGLCDVGAGDVGGAWSKDLSSCSQGNQSFTEVDAVGAGAGADSAGAASDAGVEGLTGSGGCRGTFCH
eukprot:766715-Hanusia_phi.AAC.7